MAGTLASVPVLGVSLEKAGAFFGGGLTKLGDFLTSLVSNDAAALGLVTLCGIMGETALLLVLLKRVKIFEGAGGAQVSKPGKVLATVLSAFTWLAVLKYADTSYLTSGVQWLMAQYGYIFGIALVVGLYLVWRKAAPNHPYMGMIVIGVVLLFISLKFVDSAIMALIGIIATIAGALLAIRGRTGEGMINTISRGQNISERETRAEARQREQAEHARQRQNQSRHAEEGAARTDGEINSLLRT